jgi:hypothetical protein
MWRRFEEWMTRLAVLCRGDAAATESWLREPTAGWIWFCVGVVVVASALYGATVGWWQAPLQAVYAAVKFPVLILATVFGNALLNGMLAQVLGVPLTFRQSLLAILMSFVIAALLLSAFAPVSLFLACSAPATDKAYSVVLLTHVLAIAYAGVAANVRLLRLLRGVERQRPSGSARIAGVAGRQSIGRHASVVDHQPVHRRTGQAGDVHSGASVPAQFLRVRVRACRPSRTTQQPERRQI